MHEHISTDVVAALSLAKVISLSLSNSKQLTFPNRLSNIHLNTIHHYNVNVKVIRIKKRNIDFFIWFALVTEGQLLKTKSGVVINTIYFLSRGITWRKCSLMNLIMLCAKMTPSPFSSFVKQSKFLNALDLQVVHFLCLKRPFNVGHETLCRLCLVNTSTFLSFNVIKHQR